MTLNDSIDLNTAFFVEGSDQAIDLSTRNCLSCVEKFQFLEGALMIECLRCGAVNCLRCMVSFAVIWRSRSNCVAKFFSHWMATQKISENFQECWRLLEANIDWKCVCWLGVLMVGRFYLNLNTSIRTCSLIPLQSFKRAPACLNYQISQRID